MKRKSLLTLALMSASALLALSGCTPKTQMDAPKNFAFDATTGKFTFDAVSGADTYMVGVSKVINDTTGAAIAKFSGASQVTKTDGSKVYVWSEQTGSATAIKDTDGDGKVAGAVAFRAYSNSANKVGDVIDASKLPKGHYIVQAMTDAVGDLAASDPAMAEFEIDGALTSPDGFVGSISDGKLSIIAPSNYYYNCLTSTGLPEKMSFAVKEADSLIETIDMADFSYTNVVVGPDKSYTFNNGTVKGTKTYDATKTHSIAVTAVGDGAKITDSSCAGYFGSSTVAPSLATTYDCSGSSTAGAFSISLKLGLDAAGKETYVLQATINNVAIYVESGTYTASAAVAQADGKNTYPADATINFVTTATDCSAKVMDGKSVTVSRTESQGWGGTTISYSLLGTGFSLNGTSFDFKASAGGGGWGPGPGMLVR